MPITSNIPELIEKLERIKAALAGPGAGREAINTAMFSALNAGAAKMKYRIFNQGLDANGKMIGKYSKQYAKYRTMLGRQTVYKDLEVTGSLRRSIEVVKLDEGKLAIAITNDETAKIAKYQEKQTGKKIFIVNESEFEFIKAEGNAAIARVIRQIFMDL